MSGDARPTGAGPMVQVPGGWLVPYDETIPGTSVTFRMIPVPGGTFRMGSPGTEPDRDEAEGPAFDVTVEPLWMGRCEVTWAEYRTFMRAYDLFKALEATGERKLTAERAVDAVTAPSNLYDPSTTFTNGEEDELPAVTMTQYAAKQYTKWVSRLTDRFYRLPSEAEWEHACRGGTTAVWHSGPAADTLASVAWFAANAEDTTHPVGELGPNAYGLHDMHGNVAEWVIDELVAGGYARQAALPQPVAAATAIAWPVRLYPRVLKGGSYYDEPAQCRCASRRGSVDAGGTTAAPDWKDIDPNQPKSPWWYTEAPALGVGMRIVRPLVVPAAEERLRWWDADLESIREDVAGRLEGGRGAVGLVDPSLPEAAAKAGIKP